MTKTASRARSVVVECAALIVALGFGCRPKAEERLTLPAPPPPPKRVVLPMLVRLSRDDLRSTHLRCFKGDSLRQSPALEFGESASDSTTGDMAGLTFRFTIADSGITGEAVEITGDAIQPKPLTQLALDLLKGTTAFSYGEGENRAQFAGVLS